LAERKGMGISNRRNPSIERKWETGEGQRRVLKREREQWIGQVFVCVFTRLHLSIDD